MLRCTVGFHFVSVVGLTLDEYMENDEQAEENFGQITRHQVFALKHSLLICIDQAIGQSDHSKVKEARNVQNRNQ